MHSHIHTVTATPTHPHPHIHTHIPHTHCTLLTLSCFGCSLREARRQSPSWQWGRQRRGTREQGNSGEVEGVALYCGNHKSCTFFCHSEPQSYNISELFVAVHFSVAANEESRKREQEKGSRGKEGGTGQWCSCSSYIFYVYCRFRRVFSGYFRYFRGTSYFL